MVTPTDLLEVIAAEFAEDDSEQHFAEQSEDGSWLVDGWIVRQLSKMINVDLVDQTVRCSTLPGYILWRFGHLPQAGETLMVGSQLYEVVSLDGRNITVQISKIETLVTAI